MKEEMRRQIAGPAVGDASFNAYYFEHCCGKPYRRDEHWLTFFGGVADRIIDRIQPQRVLDAGCAIGILVEALRARGVDARGIDLSSYAIANVHESVRPFCRQASVTEELTDRYDLIVTIEVVEHLPPAEGEAAIANFCRHTDDVLFSSTPIDFRETSHVNVQPPEYWAELFAGHGFHRDIDFDASFITPWAVRFRRTSEPLPRIVRGYERRFWRLAVEKNETRAFAADVQRELAQTLDRVEAAEAAREEARTVLEAERSAAANARAALERETEQLAQVRAILEAERSHAAEARTAIGNELQEISAVRVALEAALQDKLEGAAKRAQAEAAMLRDALEETHNHLTRKVVELDAAVQSGATAQAELSRVAHDLAHARATIQNMQRSMFWRARGGWARVSRLFGRPT